MGNHLSGDAVNNLHAPTCRISGPHHNVGMARTGQIGSNGRSHDRAGNGLPKQVTRGRIKGVERPARNVAMHRDILGANNHGKATAARDVGKDGRRGLEVGDTAPLHLALHIECIDHIARAAVWPLRTSTRVVANTRDDTFLAVGQKGTNRRRTLNDLATVVIGVVATNLTTATRDPFISRSGNDANVAAILVVTPVANTSRGVATFNDIGLGSSADTYGGKRCG